jgi:tetratricopeptide (TPR) repeat protein
LSTDLENPRLIAYNQLNLGLTYFRLKDYQAAREYLEKTLNDAIKINDTFAHAACQSYLGLTMEGSGEYDQAEKYFSEALETFNQITAPGYAMDSMAGLARCALKTGRLIEAKEFADQVCDYLSQQGSQGMEFPIWAYVTCAQVFEEDGDDERRQQSIEDGYQELTDRAVKIGDIEWRKTYLKEVQEHNELLAFWQHLSDE